jgi:large subunit ribosomal protein L10
MDNPRPEKVATVSEVSEFLRDADAVLLTEYRGLSVNQLAKLRRSLRQSGAEYRVYKNTLVKIAADANGIAGLDSLLTGPTAVAFVTGDAVEVAKALRDAAKEMPALVLKGGLLGTRVLDAKELVALADMPPKLQVLAEIAGLLEAPLSTLASLIEAPIRDIAYAIAALEEKQAAA